jgi:hypothetical protein
VASVDTKWNCPRCASLAPGSDKTDWGLEQDDALQFMVFHVGIQKEGCLAWETLGTLLISFYIMVLLNKDH